MMFYSFLGYLCKMHDQGDLDNLVEISGASAGALLAFCYVIGRANIKEFIHSSIHMNLGQLHFNIKNFIKNYGFIDTNICKDLTSQFCFKFLKMHDITFEQLFKLTKIKIHISAFSLDKRAVEYFSVDTSPHMSVIDAVCMSICVPFLFSPFKGHIDGSTSEDIPYIPFIDKDREDVFVIGCKRTDTQMTYTGLFSYFTYIMSMYYDIRHRCPISYPMVQIGRDVDMFDFKMNYETRYKLYTRGYSMTC